MKQKNNTCMALVLRDKTKSAELMVIRSNTVIRKGNASYGPFLIKTTAPDFKGIIQGFFDRLLKGVAGHILIKFNDKLFMCERNNIDPNKPYVRHVVKYHPLQNCFTTL